MFFALFFCSFGVFFHICLRRGRSTVSNLMDGTCMAHRSIIQTRSLPVGRCVHKVVLNRVRRMYLVLSSFLPRDFNHPESTRPDPLNNIHPSLIRQDSRANLARSQSGKAPRCPFECNRSDTPSSACVGHAEPKRYVPIIQGCWSSLRNPKRAVGSPLVGPVEP
jgi:hypothetical protein